MSVDMARVDGVPVGQCLLLWGAAPEMGAFAAACCFRVMLYAEGSVRAARRFMRALSGKFVFHLPVHQGAERMGPAPRTGMARSREA